MAVSASFGVAYCWGISGPGILDQGMRCQCWYSVLSADGIERPVILACSCLFRWACCHSGGSHLLSALAHCLFSKAAACRECSYSSSFAFSKLFRVASHCCFHLNSPSSVPENKAWVLSQL